MKDDIDQLLEAGNLDEALKAADKAVETKKAQADPQNPTSLHAYASALEVRGDVYREMDDLESSRQNYTQAIEQLQDDPDDYSLIGSLHASLGAICHVLGETAHAAHHWQIAIRHFENCNPPLLIDVATIANNLGFLYKSSGDLDSAENCFLRALEVLNAQLGQSDEQTATVFCNLGSLYQQAGFHDQSVKMHMMALNTRKKMLGRAHPDTAQSNNNLALALVETGEHDSAKKHYEDALKGFESLGATYMDDLEAVCSNYSDFLKNIGENEMAEEIANRLNRY